MKLNELTGLPEGASSMGASLLQGKWWKIDIEALVKNFAGVEADKMLELMKDSQLSKEKIEQIQNIFKKYINMAHVEKLADGVIDSAPLYRWSINFEEKQFIDMYMEILEITRIDSMDKIEIETSDIKTSIETALEKIDIKPIELSIQKKGYIPAQIKFSLGILDEDGINIADVNITSTFSSSGPVNIKAPAESTDILYLMGPIVQSSLNSARQKGQEAAIKANMSQLRPQAELFYDFNKYSYSGFCASKELKDIRKSIENSGGTGFICRATGQKYAIGVNFPQKTSGSWCVDSTGASKTVATLPSGTACPAK